MVSMRKLSFFSVFANHKASMPSTEKRANKSASLSIKDEKSRDTALLVYGNFHKLSIHANIREF